MRWLERRIILDVVDAQWKDHLLSLDHLKEGIGLRGYGQKDPLVEFKKEAFTLFEDMMARIDNETIRYLFHIQMQQGEPPPQVAEQRPEPPRPPRPERRAPWPVRRRALLRAMANRDTCPQWLATWNASNRGSRATCNTRPAPRKRKRPSRCARLRKSGATILVPVVRARNIKSATA